VEFRDLEHKRNPGSWSHKTSQINLDLKNSRRSELKSGWSVSKHSAEITIFEPCWEKFPYTTVTFSSTNSPPTTTIMVPIPSLATAFPIPCLFSIHVRWGSIWIEQDDGCIDEIIFLFLA